MPGSFSVCYVEPNIGYAPNKYLVDHLICLIDYFTVVQPVCVFPGDSLDYHNGQRFSAKDRDQDSHNSGHCAQNREGAWWYYGCGPSNLNGRYLPGGQSDHRGINLERLEKRLLFPQTLRDKDQAQ